MEDRKITTSNSRSLTRRNFLRIVAISGSAGVALRLGLTRLNHNFHEISEMRVLMGTIVNLYLISDDYQKAKSAVQATFDRMADLESTLSRFRASSQLSMLNQTGQIADAHPDLIGVLRTAEYVSELSSGAFDVTVKPLIDLYQRYKNAGGGLPPGGIISDALPAVDYKQLVIEGSTITLSRDDMGITLDGIGKGYIVDAGIERLRNLGFVNVMVEAGGDLFGSGTKNEESSWKVGVRSPRGASTDLMVTFHVRDQAVATSGDYMESFSQDFQAHHIVDPRMGYSAPMLASATVKAPTATIADALATTLMVLRPDKGLAVVNSLPECEAMLITKDLEALSTSGFEI